MRNIGVSLIRVRMVALVAFALFGMVVAGCTGSATANVTELAPARSTLVGKIDLPAVLTDSDVQTAYEMLAAQDPEMPPTLQDALEMAEQETGLDLSEFGQAIFFGDVSQLNTSRPLGMDLEDAQDVEAGYFGFIIAGAPDDLLETVRQSAEMEIEETEYEGVTILESQEDEFSFAIVDDAAVMGTPQAVRDVIDVAEGNADTIDGALRDFYTELGDPWIKVALIAPEGWTEQLGDTTGGEMGMPVDLGPMLEFEQAGIVATKEGEDAVVRVILRYATPEAATSTADTINALKTLMMNFSEDPEMDDLAQTLSITAAGEDVTIEFREDVDEALAKLEALMHQSEGMMMDPYGLGQ